MPVFFCPPTTTTATERHFCAGFAALHRDKTWGDELTLRAAADSFGVEIHVITTEKENYLLQYDPDVVKSPRKLFLSCKVFLWKPFQENGD